MEEMNVRTKDEWLAETFNFLKEVKTVFDGKNKEKLPGLKTQLEELLADFKSVHETDYQSDFDINKWNNGLDESAYHDLSAI